MPSGIFLKAFEFDDRDDDRGRANLFRGLGHILGPACCSHRHAAVRQRQVGQE